jgi:uncharacterized protein YjbI with pentapeptide repeats
MGEAAVKNLPAEDVFQANPQPAASALTVAEPEANLIPTDEIDERAHEYDINPTWPRRDFFVLKNCDADLNSRIILKGISGQFPIDPAGIGAGRDWEQEAVYLAGEGGYYPDFIESNGLYFVSLRFRDYLNQKLKHGVAESNHVVLVTEDGKRIENYRRIIPEEIDCIVKETARYGKTGVPVFFEINPDLIGGREFFKVKGYPYLIVAHKLNRIEFAGCECVRIERFFDYAGEMERLYEERRNGGRVEKLIKNFERQTVAVNEITYKYGFQGTYFRDKIKREIDQGLEKIFASHSGAPLQPDSIKGNVLKLVWSGIRYRISLAEALKTYFKVTEFEIPALKNLVAYIDTRLPAKYRQFVQQICFETVVYGAILGCQNCRRYEGIYGNLPVRIELGDEACPETALPALIYEDKLPIRRELESANDLRKYNLDGRDLRGYNLSGKILNGMKIKGADLRGAKLSGSDLNNVKLIECDLRGTDFSKSLMREAVLHSNHLHQTDFSRTDLRNAVISGSELQHCSFVESNLTAVKIRHHTLGKAYFYGARLLDAVFEISGLIHTSVFRLCNLRGARFSGDSAGNGSIIVECDFRNSDLSGCRFEACRIRLSCFLKAKLNQVNFSQCVQLINCNFQWSVCRGINLGAIRIYDNDFSFVNLSGIREKRGGLFYGNDFRSASLSGYDFSSGGYLPNRLIYTDLSDCNLENADFRTSEVFFPDFTGASLKNALFHQEQLRYVKLSSRQKREIVVGNAAVKGLDYQ